MSHPVSDAMAGMTAAERAAYKAEQYAARPAPDSLIAGTRMVSANDITTVDGVLQFTVALWIDSGVGFELMDTSAINPVRVVNPPILVPDPSGDIVRTWPAPDGSTRTETYREDLDAALTQIAFDVTAAIEGTGGLS